MTLSGVVLDCPDPQALASFYEELLGWRRIQDEPGWVKLAGPEGGAGLSFQQEEHFITPTWPAGSGDQQMQVHLDIHVDDLDAAGDARDRRRRPARERTSRRTTCGSTSTRWGTRSACSCTRAERGQPTSAMTSSETSKFA